MGKKQPYLIIIFLIVASCIVFGRIAGNDFINYDDKMYVTENNDIQSGINPESIQWALTTTYFSYWHPLTWISHMLDWSLFGANASGHHLVSLLLHIGAVIFLFLFLYKTTNNIWPSAFAAALFALHPLRVESVAWASERKDVLSMFFGMACLYAYAFYAESSRLSKYLLCLLLFALSLMSKPMLVTLPFALLLIDYWPLGRWQKVVATAEVPIAVTEKTKKKKKRKADSSNEETISTPTQDSDHSIEKLFLEKIPFVFLAIVSSFLTVWAQKKVGTVYSLEQISFLKRVANAIISYISYLGKTFWPVDLVVFYPYEQSFSFGIVLISSLVLILITSFVVYNMKKQPFLFAGWFWYLGTLIPVIGLVQVGEQAMADRYTYLPSIGIAFMLAWGSADLFQSENVRKKILFPAAIICLIVMSFLTWQQCGYWKNSVTLFRHVLQATRDNYVAHLNLGAAMFDEGKIEEALDHYNKAASVRPDKVDPYYNMGMTYNKLGRYQQAIENFNNVIRLKQEDADAYNNRGLAFESLGQYQKAIEDFSNVIRLKQEDATAFNNRGRVYGKLGNYQLAIENFNDVIRLKQEDADAYKNRGLTFFMQGNKAFGCRDAQKACALGNCILLEMAKRKNDCR